MSTTSLFDPERFKTSPYDAAHTPLPTPEELAVAGLAPKSGETTVPLSTRVAPALVFAIDRLIERRVLNIKGRQEFYRLALMNLVHQFVDEIQQEHVKQLVWRLQQIRTFYGEIQQVKHAYEALELTRKLVRMLLPIDKHQAILQLRQAKRYAEEISYKGLRERFVAGMYGATDGVERPEGWQDDELNVLWDKVWTGELDHPDGEESADKGKVFS